MSLSACQRTQRCSVLQIRDFDLNLVSAAAPQNGESHRLADAHLLQTVGEVRQPEHGAIVNRRDHVAKTAGFLVDAFQPCPFGRRTRHDGSDLANRTIRSEPSPTT